MVFCEIVWKRRKPEKGNDMLAIERKNEILNRLRNEKRVYVASDGRKWETSLQNTCMACHGDKEAFCDKCHDTNSVNPYCWDCHVIPQGNNHEFE